MLRARICAAVVAVLVGFAHFAAWASPQERAYSLPAQPLDDALAQFAASTGLQLLYDASLATGRRSGAVQGVMEPRQALSRLLDGTGLSARFTSRGAVVIYASSNSNAVALNPITAVAAPLVGRRNDAAARAYADRVRLNIVEALRRDDRLSQADVLVRVQLRLDPAGRVGDVVLQGGSGDDAWDRRFLAVVSGMRFDPPPPDLSQSLRMEFRVRRGL